jgi:hypothetical protein
MDPDASFVFQGTVLAAGAANLDAVEADELTAIVRVDRVLRAPKQMENVAGQEITIRLLEPAEVGMVAVFSANGWLYGEHLAVIETDQREGPAPPPSFATMGAEAVAEESVAAADRAARFRSELKSRADEAAAVVVGRVVGVRETASAEEERQSEHDPHWSVATVEVEQAVKGKPAETMDVLFANSDDVMWRHAPKLAVGQKATMLLQRGAPEVEDKRAHAVLSKIDVQPPDSVELVAELL